MLRSFAKTKAVSPVVATMILIVVVVVSVGSFAYLLSGLQSQSENSQSKIQNAQNEKLQITSESLYPSDPNTQFQFANGSNIDYVQYVSSTSVNVYGQIFPIRAFWLIWTELTPRSQMAGRQR